MLSIYRSSETIREKTYYLNLMLSNQNRQSWQFGSCITSQTEAI